MFNSTAPIVGRTTSTNQGAAGMPVDARVVQFGLKLNF
jgi:hypothetical protein